MYHISLHRNVENETLCLFEKHFDIMLYGFPPAPEIQLLTTLVQIGINTATKS